MGKLKNSLFAFVLLLSFTTVTYAQKQSIKWNEKPKTLIFHEGIVCTNAAKVKYKNNGKTKAIIKLTEPVIISIAEKEEPWGYYQFPSLGKDENGVLKIGWSMAEDSHKTYGKKSMQKEPNERVSFDGGKTWHIPDKEYNTVRRAYNTYLRNGDYITVDYPAAKDITTYSFFPKPVDRFNNYSYYRMSELPEDLQGAYLVYRDYANQKARSIHAQLNDPGLIRYAIDNLMPVNWWGNIKEMKDCSLIAGMYPCQYLDDKGKVLPMSVTFYRSTNHGESWNVLGHIPYDVDESIEHQNKATTDDGFAEPAFEILNNGTFLCVMRTGGKSPMYSSISIDQGKTWSKPQAIAPNGVFPQLLLLDNGVLVLASGRPGVQLRFCLDGTGENWTDPIDMMHFMNDDGTPDIFASCGYSALMPVSRNSFYLVYSDFHTKNAMGADRKSIKLRKITINKR